MMDLDFFTRSQRRMMRTCIEGGAGRNSYFAGQSECGAWDDLIARGFAVAVNRSTFGLSTFALTEAGLVHARRMR